MGGSFFALIGLSSLIVFEVSVIYDSLNFIKMLLQFLKVFLILVLFKFWQELENIVKLFLGVFLHPHEFNFQRLEVLVVGLGLLVLGLAEVNGVNLQVLYKLELV